MLYIITIPKAPHFMRYVRGETYGDARRAAKIGLGMRQFKATPMETEILPASYAASGYDEAARTLEPDIMAKYIAKAARGKVSDRTRANGSLYDPKKSRVTIQRENVLIQYGIPQ